MNELAIRPERARDGPQRASSVGPRAFLAGAGQHAGPERGRMSRYRVSMDIGGTFTDVVAYDEERGTLRRRQVVDDAARPRGGRARGARAGRRLARRDRVHGARHDAGPERLPAAPRRARAAARHGRRRRRLPHRPRQPAPPLRPALPQARAARAALATSSRSRGRLGLRAASELEPLDEDAVRAAARRARDEGFGAVAVAFLFSYVNPAHELRAEEILREELGEASPSRSRTASRASGASTSAPPRRCSTPTPRPIVRRYLERLEDELRDARPRRAAARDAVERRHRHRASRARERPLQTLLSGPVGGTMGGVALARHAAAARTSSASTWAAPASTSRLVVDGQPDVSSETALEGFPLLMRDRQHPHDRRRRRLARLRRGRRAARRARRAPGADPGPRLLRPRRHAADRDRREPRARPRRPGGLRRRAR